MNFKGFELSRLIKFTTVARPAGQIFLPAAVTKIAERYSFQKMPTLEQLVAPPQTFTFSTGAFGDFGIHELSIYSNGVIVAAAVSTLTLEAFLADLLRWAASEIGLKETGIPPIELHYESAVVVEMSVKSAKALAYLDEISPFLTACEESYGNPNFIFDFGAISSTIDLTKYPGQKPIAFTLAKRVNVPFEANIYYSTAPLTTNHHLQLLEKLERVLG
jgi:hypothetical protein